MLIHPVYILHYFETYISDLFTELQYKRRETQE